MISRPISPDLTVLDSYKLRRLANNTENYCQRLEQFVYYSYIDSFNTGYATGVRDLLHWLTGNDPTNELMNIIND